MDTARTRFFNGLLATFLWLLPACANLFAQTLSLPGRPVDAPAGTEFAQSIAVLERAEREEKIFEQVSRGNVPDFLRKLSPIQVQSVQAGRTNTATYYVAPDYLAIGSDEDYFLTPLTPATAQRIADFLHCSLPTKKMVDDIYSAAAVKLVPLPIPPSPSMTNMAIFIQHNQMVQGQRREALPEHPLGTLVAGHKKDVVISSRLNPGAGKVAIYGWHQPDGKPIQPLYAGHVDTWADYSHGIRLVQLAMEVNGAATTVPQVLTNPEFAALLSDEGVLANPRYPTAPRSPSISNPAGKPLKNISLADFIPGSFGEREVSYVLDPEVKAHINLAGNFDPKKPLQLIFYTLPNGNSTEQTIGKELKPGDDWHYDIQHIGAQTRFLRERLPDRNLVVAYLEAGGKSWPAWRKDHSDLPRRIPEIIDSIKAIFTNAETSFTLSGHSGGGSFIFGYLNAVEQLPPDLERIAFLDSNYAYDPALGHDAKLARWLKASDQHRLIVLAYDDAVALLNGTNFVSAAGGTWGRSHQMIKDLGGEFAFISQTNAEFESSTALDGRISFLLKTNPEKKIFHTVQVERNGFIHCLLSGTPLENKGYAYFGPRAYTNWIAGEIR